MLKIENLCVSYGGIKALRGISLEVPDGKIVTLIGANGAPEEIQNNEFVIRAYLGEEI